MYRICTHSIRSIECISSLHKYTQFYYRIEQGISSLQWRYTLFRYLVKQAISSLQWRYTLVYDSKTVHFFIAMKIIPTFYDRYWTVYTLLHKYTQFNYLLSAFLHCINIPCSTIYWVYILCNEEMHSVDCKTGYISMLWRNALL